MATKNARKSVKSASASKKVVKSKQKRLDITEMTAQQQNAAYAKMAKKYTLDSEVVELAAPKRKGRVVREPLTGSAWIGILFEDSTEVQEKFASDIRMVKQAKPVKLKFKTGSNVEHPAHGRGVVTGKTTVDGVVLVQFVGTPVEAEPSEVHQDELILVKSTKEAAKDKKAPAKADSSKNNPFKKGDSVTHPKHGTGVVSFVPDALHIDILMNDKFGGTRPNVSVEGWAKVAKAARPSRVKFEAISLFGAFSDKDRTFVKVSKSNAIPAQVQGSVDEPFAMLATVQHKMADSAIQRFKKTDKVTPYQGGVVQEVAAVPQQ